MYYRQLARLMLRRHRKGQPTLNHIAHFLQRKASAKEVAYVVEKQKEEENAHK